jgi:hypothetical protein
MSDHLSAGTVAPLVQIEQFAVTVRGHYLEDAMQDKELHEVIRARTTTSRFYAHALTALEQEKVKNPQVDHESSFYRDESNYTDQELDATDRAGTQQYLVIGYALRGAAPRSLKKFPPTTKKNNP